MMDTSKKYIEMCEKAEEIQKLWEPQGGDFTADRQNYVMMVESTDLYTKTLQKKDIKKLAIWWLPRQDQLQEIYIGLDEDTLDRMFSMCESFTDKTYIDHWKPWHFFESMEQLWLAFVMKEKYNKTWNGKEWVK